MARRYSLISYAGIRKQRALRMYSYKYSFVHTFTTSYKTIQDEMHRFQPYHSPERHWPNYITQSPNYLHHNLKRWCIFPTNNRTLPQHLLLTVILSQRLRSLHTRFQKHYSFSNTFYLARLLKRNGSHLNRMFPHLLWRIINAIVAL